ncbi:MAG: tRNA uridine-5-carboxymethylaminomethyl(34) synthesis GTPase MnmE [Thermodesulfovibrionales bacterium]
MPEGDTISAVSTSRGEAGIGIVRMSGPGAIAIADRLFVSPGGRRPSQAESHRLLYGHIADPATGEAVDEVLLAVMRAPRTYTREDVVEINCHGGMVPLGRVLELTIAAGARLAGPGEFTRRAFLNGRLDLSQAEAALDIIRARTDQAERVAMSQLRGALSGRVNSLRERLLGLCAHLEAWLDFPEEDIEPAAADEIKRMMGAVMEDVAALARSYERGRLYREGLRAVIAGRPNVGKSSLLNALLERDRAIVTDEPGTTRDVIEECVNIRGLPLVVIDTAGIRQARDMAEEEGVRRSLRAIEEADLVLGVLDGSEPLGEGDLELLRRLEGSNAILVANKCDLPRAPMEPPAGLALFRVSARTGEGMEALKDGIYGRFAGGGGGAAEEETVMVTNLRHRLALEAAGRSLEAAAGAMGRSEPLEIAAMEMREALEHLGAIVGAVSADDILDRIFGEFCIGK